MIKWDFVLFFIYLDGDVDGVHDEKDYWDLKGFMYMAIAKLNKH